LNSLREQALAAYQAALAAVHGRAAVQRHLAEHLHDGAPHVVAIGKAGAAMLQGARDALGAALRRGLLITRRGYLDAGLCTDPRLSCLEAGHPAPDAASLAAGAVLLDFITATPPEEAMLFLISGGASALVESLPEGVSLQDWQHANAWMLAHGLDIHDINRLRKRLSCIKGGRLARLLTGRRAMVLLMSDVPGDVPAAIGSGLLVPDTAGPVPPQISAALPPWFRDLLGRAPAIPAADDVAFGQVRAQVLIRNEDALAAAQTRLATPPRHLPPMSGDALTAGTSLARELLCGPSGWLLAGGETTVTLPPQPGEGGRCQTLALAAALEMQGRADVCLLAAGTDGSDGNSAAAGALVDGATIARGRAAGLDPHHCLAAADAGRFLAASGDLVTTGPSGSNVMDIVIACKAG
jgi:hydroxypyruvate reductase